MRYATAPIFPNANQKARSIQALHADIFVADDALGVVRLKRECAFAELFAATGRVDRRFVVFDQGFAVLARVAARDIFKIFLEQHFETEQHSRALYRWRFRPCRKCRRCGVHRVVHMHRRA